jgi:cytochrome c-type biogenesis protein CcmH
MNSFWSITLFWAFAAVAVVLALAFVLPWLMRQGNVQHAKAARRDINLAVYRDQMKDLVNEFANGQLTEEQFRASKLELETRAAEDALAQEDRASAPVASRRLGYSLVVVLPAATIALYAWLGNPNALVVSGGGAGPAAMAAPPTAADMLQIIQRIEERAQATPDDTEVWETLANANAMMARWPEALQAYQRSLELSPGKPSVLSGYAEALAMNGNMLMAGRPMEMVNMALQTDPNDRKGLELAAIHAFQSQEYAQAAQFLDRLLRLLPPDMPYAQEILKMRNEALQLAEGGGGTQAAGAAAGAAPGAAPGAAGSATGSVAGSVAGSVDLAPELQAQLGPQSTVYLIARDGQSGAPLAAARVALGAFPLSFRLDDSMAMNPANALSDHKEVVLLARISASGNPIAQPGDLESRVVSVAVGATDATLVIDRVVP